MDAYEELLKTMVTDDRYAEEIGRFFKRLNTIRATIKKSNDNKASKKAKEALFDEASGMLKDIMEEAMQLTTNSEA